MIYQFVVTFLLLSCWHVSNAEFDLDVERGRAQYDMVKAEVRMPRYGSCWQKALENLHNGCRALTDDVQARLALSFANCFLAKAGLKSYSCDPDSEISQCLKDIDSNAFTAYSNFFTHTQNMCQFLQAQVWRDRTEGTILSLSANSARVAESLHESSKIQDTIVSNQMQTLEYQKQIMANGSVLSHAIEMSKSNVKEMLQEFRSSTDEQRMLIFSIFDRVAKLQNLVISEVSWIYTMLFYGVSMVVLYLMTATKRTAEARFPLFIVLTLNFILERFICAVSLPADTDFGEEVPEIINDRVWLLRKMSLSVSFFILTYFASTFQDYNLINHKLLQDICKQNRELCHAIELIKSVQNATLARGGDHETDFSPLTLTHLDTDGEEVEEGEDSDSDAHSFDSTQTDRTWMEDRDLVDVNDDDDYDDLDEEVVEDFSFLDGDFFTAANNSPSDSGQTTPTNRADSKERDLSPHQQQQQQDLLNRSCHDLMLPTSIQDSSRKKVGRPRGPSRKGGWSEDGSRPGTPCNHGYNLRRRTGYPVNFDNPILDEESPNAFGKFVSHLSHISQKQSIFIRQKFRELQRGEDSVMPKKPFAVSAFSSDEDN